MDIRQTMDFISSNGIEMVNFMYPAADGRLKTLNFTVNDEDYLLSVLRFGERVDGSSLFPFIEAGNSDLYVIPRLGTMFLDPFASRPTACFLCAFLDKNGRRLDCSPEYTLLKARDAFRRRTGMDFEAMGELEFYVSAPLDEDLEMYPASDQKGYHESAPFAKFNDFRTECMYRIMKAGGKIKYGHSEVGNFTLDGRLYEQNEIEFLPVDVVDAADQLMLAKWIIRNTAAEYGLDVSFAPKITAGKAGSGLHVHMRITKVGENMLVDGSGSLSQTARRAIAGMMMLAPSITAFGNANPVSYLRLVPHQEAPTSICWGDRNEDRHVRRGERPRGFRPLRRRHRIQTDGRDTLGGLLCGYLPAALCALRRVHARTGDARRRRRGREDLCRCGHTQEVGRGACRGPGPSARFLPRVGRTARKAAWGL